MFITIGQAIYIKYVLTLQVFMSENIYLKSKEESSEKNQIQLTVVLFPILFCHLTDTCHLSLTLRLVLGLKTDFLTEYT